MDAGVGNLRAHVGTGLHDQSRNREGSEAHQPGRDGLQTGASETLHHAELDPLQQQQINQAATLSGRADVRAFESSRGVATSPRDATGGAAAKTWLAEADRGFGLNLRSCSGAWTRRNVLATAVCARFWPAVHFWAEFVAGFRAFGSPPAEVS